MVTISVGTVSRKFQAQKFVDAIHGKSYMDFQVKIAPAGGEFEVLVQTQYFDNMLTGKNGARLRQEIANRQAQDMLNLVMFGIINRGG